MSTDTITPPANPADPAKAFGERAAKYLASIQAFIVVHLAGRESTWEACWELVSGGIALFTDLARELNAPGAEKKKLVVDIAAQAFDIISPSLPLPWYLAVARPFVMPAAREAMLWLAGATVEGVYSRLKRPD